MQRQGLVGEVQRERLVEMMEEQRREGLATSEPGAPQAMQAALFDEDALVDLGGVGMFYDDGVEEEEDEEERAPAPMG
jgi:hypothetical protein